VLKQINEQFLLESARTGLQISIDMHPYLLM
jgi:hypothetical protein